MTSAFIHVRHVFSSSTTSPEATKSPLALAAQSLPGLGLGAVEVSSSLAAVWSLLKLSVASFDVSSPDCVPVVVNPVVAVELDPVVFDPVVPELVVLVAGSLVLLVFDAVLVPEGTPPLLVFPFDAELVVDSLVGVVALGGVPVFAVLESPPTELEVSGPGLPFCACSEPHAAARQNEQAAKEREKRRIIGAAYIKSPDWSRV